MKDLRILNFCVKASALMARMEAMKVENIMRAINDSSPAYGEDDFFKVEKELNELSDAIQNHKNESTD